ncbi:MAG TPA: aldo/keto reductase [Streptosporangiaceae bacterium]|jgi:aryl-alcohol dehydrogenase-like predicted oxidoreductase
MHRVLGRSGIEVSAIGFGCWAIGGPFTIDGKPSGWGAVDDDESIAALRRAMDLGVTFFDTADVYGAGHSELVLGKALAGHRDEAVIATKFGYTFDISRRQATGLDASPAYIRKACEASLQRLGTDWIDLYQLHVGDLPAAAAVEAAGTLDELVADGLIRAYGWSTDDTQAAAAFARGTGCAAIQHELNVLADRPEMLAVCERANLASVNRGPLAMGLLSGKYGAASAVPADDVRATQPWVSYFAGGRPAPEWLTRMDAIRAVLTKDGRTLAQGALGWLLACSPQTVPIPGIRTVRQAEENAAALRLGPLPGADMAEIARLLDR